VAILGPAAPPAWLDPELWEVREGPWSQTTSRATPTPRDVLVIPEVLAAEPAQRGWQGRRVVFVQGAYLIQPALSGRSYAELGYERAIAVLPHVRGVVERHFGVPATLVPPFLARYLFASPGDSAKRQRRILAFPKAGYAEAGFFDYAAGVELIRRRLTRRHPSWTLLEVEGQTHRVVAGLMRDSELMVSFNSFEAFNTTVPEAMAAGCLPLCYEGLGGRDFLRAGLDSFVFRTHDYFALVEALDELLQRFEERRGEILQMRLAAIEAASRFDEGTTRSALDAFFGDLFGSDQQAG
jgi:glycosyltransferase involved in cell wall biosynthesis